MNDGAKVKAPAAYLLRGAFGGLSGYLKYPVQSLNSQYYLQWSTRFIRYLSTFLVQAGGRLTPATGRPCRHGDTPQWPRVARPTGLDARGCGLTTASFNPSTTPTKRRTRDGHPGLFRGQLMRRPMTSVVRAHARVNSSAFAARHSAEGRESGRG